MNDSNLDKNTRERIIEATLSILKKDGMAGVSTRKIVKLANVNVAAVNYHFGSKDNIINEALNYLIEKINRIFITLEDDSSPEIRLNQFINQFIDNMISCPVALKGSMSRMIKDEVMPNELVENLKLNYDRLFITLRQINPDEDEVETKMKMMQLVSSIIYPMVIGDYTRKLSGLDFNDKNTRDRYIKLIINSIK